MSSNYFLLVFILKVNLGIFLVLFISIIINFLLLFSIVLCTINLEFQVTFFGSFYFKSKFWDILGFFVGAIIVEKNALKKTLTDSF